MRVERILPGYTARAPIGPVARLTLGAGLLALAAFYGLMCALLPAQLLFIPLLPVLILAGLCLWMLPDADSYNAESLWPLMLWFAALFAPWPNYVAFDLPGLPWITPLRIVAMAMMLVFLLGIAMSQQLRDTVMDRMRAVPLLFRLFWAYWLATTVSLAFSSQPAFSVNKYANNQIFWTMVFAITAMVASRPGFVRRAAQLLVATCMFTVLVGLYEARVRQVFFLPHLPSFLKVDPEFLEKVAAAQNRAGTDVYRVRSTMAVSLYYAQYLAMVFPLTVFFLIKAQGLWRKALLLAGAMGMVVVMYYTNARSAMVGLLLTVAVLPFFLAWRRRRERPDSVLATATLLSYPAMLAVLATIVLTWRRAYVAVIGGGQHQPSSLARELQWKMGWPKVFTHPLGHGAGRNADVLGYANGNNDLTIDTYYLSVLLDYGFLALPIFIAMFALPVWYGLKAMAEAQTIEEQLAAPLAVGLFNFVVIAGVLSSEGNIPLAFLMLGCLVGIIWQQNQRKTAATPAIGLMPSPPQLALPAR